VATRAQQTPRRVANKLQSMEKLQYAPSESDDMSEININRFIEAARQYLFGLFPDDAIRTSASKVR
jgi:two-component sensor histidine kinase